MNIDELWQAALADARIEANDAVLFALPGEQSNSGDTGKAWPRGVSLVEPEDSQDLAEYFGVANGSTATGLRRLAVWTDRSTEGLAAVLRHELEHTCQFDAHGAVLVQLHHNAVRVLNEHAEGVPGNGFLYNEIPMEADANAAASAFVRATFGEARIEKLLRHRDPHSGFFRRTEPPQPIETLLERMRAFILRDGARIAKEFARRGGPPA